MRILVCEGDLRFLKWLINRSAEKSPDIVHDETEHLVITAHGISTYGQWTHRLETLTQTGDYREQSCEKIAFEHHDYGWFPIIQFLIPPIRWLFVRQFRNWLKKCLRTHPNARVSIVAHSFGTHLVGWGLRGMRKDQRPKGATLIFAGSVLKPTFDWSPLFDDGTISRIANECGSRDSVLVVNQLFVLFTGMAGRVGFLATNRFKRNRHYQHFGHSGFYLDKNGKSYDDFMRDTWLPILRCPTADIEDYDDRPYPPPQWHEFMNLVLQNLEAVKVSVYMLAVLAVAGWFRLQRNEAIRQREIAEARRERGEETVQQILRFTEVDDALKNGKTRNDQLKTIQKDLEELARRFKKVDPLDHSILWLVLSSFAIDVQLHDFSLMDDFWPKLEVFRTETKDSERRMKINSHLCILARKAGHFALTEKSYDAAEKWLRRAEQCREDANPRVVEGFEKIIQDELALLQKGKDLELQMNALKELNKESDRDAIGRGAKAFFQRVELHEAAAANDANSLAGAAIQFGSVIWWARLEQSQGIMSAEETAELIAKCKMKALSVLKRAVTNGFDDLSCLESNSVWKVFHDDAAINRLLTEIREHKKRSSTK